MSFSTTSYLAGVGTVVAALTVGFCGAFFLASPAEHVEQNRLQRVASSAALSNPTSQEAITPKPEITPARSIELVSAKMPGPELAPEVAKAAEPARAKPEENTARSDVNMEKMRAAEAKAERKRAREQRRAERRKQRDIELATAAVKRMARDRDLQQVADRSESPRFGFFGED
jgi:type IV secretory pathway VirB10-like protein